MMRDLRAMMMMMTNIAAAVTTTAAVLPLLTLLFRPGHDDHVVLMACGVLGGGGLSLVVSHIFRISRYNNTVRIFNNRKETSTINAVLCVCVDFGRTFEYL